MTHACASHPPGSRQCHVNHGCDCPECLKASYAYGKQLRVLADRAPDLPPADRSWLRTEVIKPRIRRCPTHTITEDQ